MSIQTVFRWHAQRWPRFERPRRRAISVEAPKSHRCAPVVKGSRSGWLSSQAMPARRRRQGAPDRPACAVFFKADPMAIEEPPHRAGQCGQAVSPYVRQVALFQQRLQLGECDVRRLLHLRGQQERGRALDPARKCRSPPLGSISRARCGPSGATHQPNGWRSTRSRRTVQDAAPRSIVTTPPRLPQSP